MSALREQLIDIIRRLPEEQLLLVAPAVQVVDDKPPRSLAECLERADALYAKLKGEVITMPDVVDILHEVREERLNAIMGLR